MKRPNKSPANWKEAGEIFWLGDDEISLLHIVAMDQEHV